MTARDSKEHMNKREKGPTERSADTHSGTPNSGDPNDQRSTEHKSGYGGEAGKPRTSSDEGQRTDK
jgi:hypothetical protein